MGKPELNLHVDEELLARAQAIGLPAERVAEEAIRLAVSRADAATAEARARQWALENAEALEAHRRQIAEHGAFGDDLRTW